MKNWFESWFDSPYYHILYKERDDQEAKLFLDHLIQFLKPANGARILDVACGKGRHALYLNEKGFDVTGFDLSPENIEYDQQYENEKLSFFIHDMREVFRVNYFDCVFNLFSSFGYFEKERDHTLTIRANAESLKEGGILVLDFMNSVKVKSRLVAEESKTMDGISFRIQKKIENGSILKKISFTDGGKEYEFCERLRLFTREDFEKYFSQYNLSIVRVAGDYMLNAFDEQHSERLILIARKN
ncbi:MAG: class I SAM-dependent methyltransferase [Bacteroidetes bacterium]|nr:class I SAM-dependent methyltransferase [Bacteroidota bacterium]